MIIYHWSGQGYNMMAGCTEYIFIVEEVDDFQDNYPTEREAIEANTAPGFEFSLKYDTDIDTDFSALPLDRMLKVTS